MYNKFYNERKPCAKRHDVFMKKELHVLSTHLSDLHPCDLVPVKYGHTQSKNPILYTPHWDYYVIHYIFHGKGTLFMGDVPYPVTKGECFLICPGDKAAYIADKDDPWHSGWIGFRGEAGKQLTNLPSPVFSMPADLFQPLLFMKSANDAEDYLLLSILYKMYAALFARPQTTSNYAEEAELYIRQHFHESITIASLATRLGITPRYLSALFKQNYGKTTQSHLMEVRLTHARNLLLQGYSVSKVAFEVGYSDPFVFSRAFCRYFGIPPKSFIKKGDKMQGQKQKT